MYKKRVLHTLWRVKHCHCEPVTDVTGVAISQIGENIVELSENLEIPTPVCALARNDIIF